MFKSVIVGIIIIFISFYYIFANTIAFLRGNDEIWIYDDCGKNQEFICNGYDPDISPNGKFIAFTLYEDLSRKIAIVDIKTKKVKVLNSIPGSNSSKPKWAPNGKKIAFNYRNGTRWVVGIIDQNNNEFNILNKDIESFSCSWSFDGKYIICHDAKYIYKLNLDGSIVFKKLIKNIIDNNGISSATDFYLFEDKNNRYILFDAIPDTEGEIYDLPSAIFIYDLNKEQIERITPKNILAANPRWYDRNNIIFNAITENDISVKTFSYMKDKIPFDIYKISLKSKEMIFLIKNGYYPSSSKIDNHE